jgi:hypothetical protein
MEGAKSELKPVMLMEQISDDVAQWSDWVIFNSLDDIEVYLLRYQALFILVDEHFVKWILDLLFSMDRMTIPVYLVIDDDSAKTIREWTAQGVKEVFHLSNWKEEIQPLLPRQKKDFRGLQSLKSLIVKSKKDKDVEEDPILIEPNYPFHHEGQWSLEDLDKLESDELFSIDLPKQKTDITKLKESKKRLNVVMFVSGSSTGKTFLALNMALCGSRKQKVTLVDLNPNRGLHTWANLPSEERGLLSLFSESQAKGFTPIYASNLEIFGVNPDDESEMVTPEMMARLIEKIESRRGDQGIVLDVPLQHPYFPLLCQKVDSIYAVFDSDYQHFLQWQRDWVQFNDRAKVKVIWNQKEDIRLPFEEMLGVSPSYDFPKFEGVTESLYRGRPYLIDFPSAQSYFEKLSYWIS